MKEANKPAASKAAESQSQRQSPPANQLDRAMRKMGTRFRYELIAKIHSVPLPPPPALTFESFAYAI